MYLLEYLSYRYREYPLFWTLHRGQEYIIMIKSHNLHTHKHTQNTKQRAFAPFVCEYTNTFLGKCLDVLRSKASYAYALMRSFPSKYLLLLEFLCFESALGESLGSIVTEKRSARYFKFLDCYKCQK